MEIIFSYKTFNRDFNSEVSNIEKYKGQTATYVPNFNV